MTEEPTNPLFTTCTCYDPAHSMEFRMATYPDEEPTLYVSVQLNQRHPWWRRLGLAAQYVLGKRSRFSYGHWDEGNINLEGAVALSGLLGRFEAEACAFRARPIPVAHSPDLLLLLPPST